MQIALNDVSLNLRDNEFVAILGPSGSGKTTLLNIIGGLDRYDEGDLIINGISTKNYKDRDWDAYRNHTIGFVFQSYNLIPHQSVLSNVELALTISGIGRAERRKRALDALEKVGLKEQAHKKPNQMSGGQMQRVAIARALVNDPDILLADEPTGALDTQTSIQVMDLLKEVAEDRLVVMVTHNPELAQQYATRIVRLRDGKITDDSDPFIPSNIEAEPLEKKMGKAHMSFLTALSLSFNNLLTKKGRTILTAFAGSIGIIGIALILSLSTGFQNYIDKIQEDTLSSYPLTITSETADASSMILSMVSTDEENRDGTEILQEKQYITSMFSSVGSNDIPSFRRYLDEHEEEVSENVYLTRYTYSVSPLIYTIDAADKIVQINPSSMMSSIYSNSASSFLTSYSSGRGIFSEAAEIEDSVKDQYDVLKGRWPEKHNEVIVVLSEPNSISDLLVYSLGLRDTAEMKEMISKLMAGETVEKKDNAREFTYDDLLNLDLRLIDATDLYHYNPSYDVYEDMTSDTAYMEKTYLVSERLYVTGIVCAKENSSTMALSPGVVYLKELTDHVIEEASSSYIVRKQMREPEIDVFSGKRFDEQEEEEKKTLDFQDMISVDQNAIRNAFRFNLPANTQMSEEDSAKLIMAISRKTADSIMDNSSDILTAVLGLDTTLSQLMIQNYPKSSAVNGIACEIYVDENDPLKGCQIPEGKDDEYVTLNDTVFRKDQVISFEDDTLQTYKDNFFNNVLKELASQLPSEFAYVDPAMLSTLSRDVVEKVFGKYVETVLALNNGEKNVSVELLSAIDQRALVLAAIADPAIQESLYKQSTDIVSQYTTMMIAAGIGEAVARTMEPMAQIFSQKDLFTFDSEAFSRAFTFNLDQEELQRLMEAMMDPAGEKSYKSNLLSLGYQDRESPTSISFYFRDFEAKENFLDFLKEYNQNAEEEQEIHYTDITGILMSSVKTIVDSVSYVLIAFVSISLIVSSIMIAVITLISVMERTKEIGILRAMGASKRNVSSIFNAETFIIGLLSGVLGILVSWLALFPINSLIHSLTGNYDINAVLPREGAITLIIISVILTIIAGFIPSKSAAKKDPVIALRTE